jgi:hypothetical protein
MVINDPVLPKESWIYHLLVAILFGYFVNEYNEEKKLIK